MTPHVELPLLRRVQCAPLSLPSATRASTDALNLRVTPMLDLRYVVENLDAVRANLARRGEAATAGLDQIATLATERRATITAEEQLAAELNVANAAMAKIADKKSADFQTARDRLRTIGDQKKQHEQRRTESEARIADILLR